MFSNPKKNVEQLRIALGAYVADFGSGSGHYITALREVVGDTGRVFAVDIQKDLLTRIKRDATGLGYTNVEVVWGDLEKKGGSKLNDGILDALVISNLMFQVKEKAMVAEEAKRVVKQGGTLFVSDWTDTFSGIGPRPDAVFTKNRAVEIFQEHGFLFEREIDSGAHHYGLVFKKV